MAVTLRHNKSAVVDSLRAARNADDELSRLQENSWEHKRKTLAALVESANWRYGPAELIATFPHHLIAKAPSGHIVQVEWEVTDGKLSLGRTVVHEMATPVADLGRELMETAKSAVDHILEEDYEGAQPMISTMAEALDSGGDLQRRIQNEITVQSLKRNAWWHGIVGERDGIEEMIPQPNMEDDESISKSVNDLLIFLREAAVDGVNILHKLEGTAEAKDLEIVATDIGEDIERAMAALSGVNLRNQEESLQIYEAVMAATPRLLNGIAFLSEFLAEEQEPAQEG
jgi:hypothetical protein